MSFLLSLYPSPKSFIKYDQIFPLLLIIDLFQIPVYEKRKTLNLDEHQEETRNLHVLPKNKMGKTMSLYPHILLWHIFYCFQWHQQVFNLNDQEKSLKYKKTVLRKRSSDLTNASFIYRLLSLEIIWNAVLTMLEFQGSICWMTPSP